jgi:hypothetical protein
MRTLTIDVDDQVYDKTIQLIGSRQWTLDGGLRHLIHLGIETARLEDRLSSSDDPTAVLRNEVLQLGADYASMRFQLFIATENNRILEMNCNGFKASVETYKTQISLLRQEIAALKKLVGGGNE